MAVETGIWQVHLPSPKCVDRPHYKVTIPNEMHQFDRIIYMGISISTTWQELMLLQDIKS